ncbi:uncharacterized protein METZ01_LOCUS41783, partial [marine metagenome]
MVQTVFSRDRDRSLGNAGGVYPRAIPNAIPPYPDH